MAIQKSLGIVLRRQDLRETSLIVTFYTRDFGKIKGILRGVRGDRAQWFGGSLEVLSLDEIVFYENKKRDIYTVSQCDLAEFFNPIRESLDKLSHAAYIAELLDSVTGPGETNVEVFDLLLNSLRLMAGESSPRRVTRIFEIKILYLLGLMPSLGSCASCSGTLDSASRFSVSHGGLICRSCLSSDRDACPILPGTVRFMAHIQSMAFEKVARVKVSAEVGRELERILRKFLDYHIERRMKTLEFMRKIS